MSLLLASELRSKSNIIPKTMTNLFVFYIFLLLLNLVHTLLVKELNSVIGRPKLRRRAQDQSTLGTPSYSYSKFVPFVRKGGHKYSESISYYGHTLHA